jgi:predicted Zn-dependent peptidase
MTVETTRLSNGITVATQRFAHVESVALGVWVKAGSRNELENEHGIAHMLEHMAFKGTVRRDARTIAEEIENVGGEINAATSVETTSYFVRVLKDDVPLALDLLSDILQNSKFDPDELEREKHVVLQELGAADDTPDDAVFDRFTEAAFRHQPIGRAILGTRETIASFTPDQIRGYIDREYCGERMVIAATGAIDHDDFVKRVEEHFGSISGQAEGQGRIARALCRRRLPRTPPAAGHAVPARLRGPRLSRARFLRLAGARHAARRRHVVAPVSRKCAKSAASATRSTPSTGAFPTPASSASTRRPNRATSTNW